MIVRSNKFCFCFRTAFQRTPKIGGRDVDLYLLYVLVTTRGGWEKVSQRTCSLPWTFYLQACILQIMMHYGTSEQGCGVDELYATPTPA